MDENERYAPSARDVDGENGKDLGISHLDRHLLYESVEVDLLPMVKVSYFYIKNPTQATPLNESSF